MKKIFVSTAIVLLLLSVLAGATFAAPALAGKQELPFKGTLQSVEAYVINFPIMSVTASGSGNATQLGRFTVNYEVEVNLLTLAGIGSAQFISANGDSLYAEGLGQAAETGTPGVVNVVEVYTITGGTGRFAGASGNITWKRVVDTNTGVTSGTLSGNIVLR
jgi:hypothetical protein